MMFRRIKWPWVFGGAGALAALWWLRRERPFDDHYRAPAAAGDSMPFAVFGESPIQLVVPEGRLTGRYGTQRTATHVHRGIDIAAPEGAEVHSPQHGIVLGVWPDCTRKGYGNNLLVKHDDGRLTFYAHLQNFAVVAGQRVAPGTVLGWVGSTRCGINRATMAPHLHLEVHTSVVGPAQRPTINETTPGRVDPLNYLEQLWRGDSVVV